MFSDKLRKEPLILGPGTVRMTKFSSSYPYTRCTTSFVLWKLRRPNDKIFKYNFNHLYKTQPTIYYPTELEKVSPVMIPLNEVTTRSSTKQFPYPYIDHCHKLQHFISLSPKLLPLFSYFTDMLYNQFLSCYRKCEYGNSIRLLSKFIFDC